MNAIIKKKKTPPPELKLYYDKELIEDWDWEVMNVIRGKAVAIVDNGWKPRGLRYDT